MEDKKDHLTPFEAKKLANKYFKGAGRRPNFKVVELKKGWVFVVDLGSHDNFASHDVYISDPKGLIKNFLTFSEVINVATFISDGSMFNMKVYPGTPFSASDRA